MKRFIGTFVDVQNYGFGVKEVEILNTREESAEWMRNTLLCVLEVFHFDEEIIEKVKSWNGEEALMLKTYKDIVLTPTYAYINDEVYLDVFEKEIEIDKNAIVADKFVEVLSERFGKMANSNTIDTTFIRNYKDREGDEQFIKECINNYDAEELIGEIFGEEILDDAYSLVEGEGVCLEGDKWEYLRDKVASLGYTDLINIYNGEEEVIKSVRKNIADEYAILHNDNLFPTKKFTWTAKSDDGWSEKAEETFSTEEECYDDMRHAALIKMSWNTEYSDCEEYDTIGYEVHFSKKKIVHKSYSGEYTYEIKEVFE